MQPNPSEQIVKRSTLVPFFPLQYNSDKNIYILLDNAFACKLVQLHIGNRVPESSIETFTWYLHPEETLYLISVQESNETGQQKNRQELIRTVYRNALKQDIDAMHFYVNIRKRNKFCRRVDEFLFSQFNQTAKEALKQVKQYRLFKIYESQEDYKRDINCQYCLLTGTSQSISFCLFNSFIEEVKKSLNIGYFLVCVFENNDFIFVSMKDV